MKHLPSQDLKEFIDCYWIVNNVPSFFNYKQQITAYPGVTPEIMIPLDGDFSYNYKSRWIHTTKATVFSFIEEKLVLDNSRLKAFIIIQFKPLGLLSLRQFITVSSKKLMAKSICNADEIFTSGTLKFTSFTKNAPVSHTISELNAFFLERLQQKSNFQLEPIVKSLKNGTRLKDIGLSYATLERNFKIETGLTPKRFQTLQRFKMVVQEICQTKNNDWIHYVEKYNYYDQSHFIKDIKRYTTFTPKQLYITPSLLDYRTISR